MLLAASTFAAEVKVGDSVLGYWAETQVYYTGTAVEQKGTRFVVVFDDGDTAELPADKVRVNDIKAGSKVAARWTDGEYYRGTVAKVVGRALYIHYADGDKGWVPWSWIAVEK